MFEVSTAFRSPLCTVVARVIREVAANTDDHMSQRAVADAVDELIDLDPDRPLSWRLRGLAEGWGLPVTARLAPEAVLALQYVGGLLEACAERDDSEGLAALALDRPREVDAVFGNGLARDVAGPLLTALLATRPVRLAEVARCVERPFAEWHELVDAVEGRAARLREVGDSATAVTLLDGVHAMLQAWFEAQPQRDDLKAACAHVTLERAKLRIQRAFDD